MANRMLGLMARKVKVKSPDIMTKTFKSFLTPHLEYFAPAWCILRQHGLLTMSKIRNFWNLSSTGLVEWCWG